MKFSLEHILILSLVVWFCYYFMYNCSCIEGVKFENRLAKETVINGSDPGIDCELCGGAIVTTLLSTMGPDEIPVAGQALGAFEFLTALGTCGECGVDVGKSAGCLVALKDDGQTRDARMCTCTDAKICPYGTPYRPLEGGLSGTRIGPTEGI